MRKICPFSCKIYAKRHYTVKYAKPPKRRSPRPTHSPKHVKPTPRPTPALSLDEKEDLKEATEEYAEEEETRHREEEEQRKQKDEEVSQLQALPVVRNETPSAVRAPALDDLNIDASSKYNREFPISTQEKKQFR